MEKMITRLFAGALWCIAFTAYAGISPAVTPQIFSPKVLSNSTGNMSPAFTPDGDTVYLMRDAGSGFKIIESHRVDGHWTKPEMTSFSGHWRDLDPAMSPDGSFMIFVSNRPATPGSKPLDAKSQGKTYSGKGMNLWRVDRKDNGWGTPVRLPDSVNRCSMTFAPTITADGSIYFIGCTESGSLRLLRSQYSDDHYLAPTVVAIGSADMAIRDPAVALDEAFIVFSSKPAHGKQPYRIHIAFRKNGHWTKPIELGNTVNKSGNNMANRLGPNRRTLYYSAKNKIWKISLAPRLQDHHEAN